MASLDCSPEGIEPFSNMVSTPFWASPHHQRMLSPLGKPAQDKLQQEPRRPDAPPSASHPAAVAKSLLESATAAWQELADGSCYSPSWRSLCSKLL